MPTPGYCCGYYSSLPTSLVSLHSRLSSASDSRLGHVGTSFTSSVLAVGIIMEKIKCAALCLSSWFLPSRTSPASPATCLSISKQDSCIT